MPTRLLPAHFNTHSLAGVHRSLRCSNDTFLFQYSLPRGSASAVQSKYRSSLDFNTHSLAGVHQAEVEPLVLKLFQYSLPRGSASPGAIRPRGTLFQYSLPRGSASRFSIMQTLRLISILTPSRECIFVRNCQDY